MLDDRSLKKIKEISSKYKSKVYFDHSLKSHTTIMVGGSALLWHEPVSLEELREMREFLEHTGIAVFVIGNGSNVLIPDEGVNRAVVSLSNKNFRGVSSCGLKLTAGAGAKLSEIISYCSENSLSGFEGMVGIPATLGGALRINASHKCAISDYLESVKLLLKNGKVESVGKKDIKFGYRYSSIDKGAVIVEAVFSLGKDRPAVIKERAREYFTEKLAKQPLEKNTLGCVFKNFSDGKRSSGELIDKAGLKGAAFGDAYVSEKHANFIVNRKCANAKDVINLIKHVREKVEEKFAVKLETEIEII
ncbi:MAG: UDP-N-acetylmuramate dehydrogenase [Candidatus Omnitrophica bacterium]|nr:UDP-N-acetylmuramate dehydrogenase [Candidatus Omnitrophota bacterium]